MVTENRVDYIVNSTRFQEIANHLSSVYLVSLPNYMPSSPLTSSGNRRLLSPLSGSVVVVETGQEGGFEWCEVLRLGFDLELTSTCGFGTDHSLDDGGCVRSLFEQVVDIILLVVQIPQQGGSHRRLSVFTLCQVVSERMEG